MFRIRGGRGGTVNKCFELYKVTGTVHSILPSEGKLIVINYKHLLTVPKIFMRENLWVGYKYILSLY